MSDDLSVYYRSAANPAGAFVRKSEVSISPDDRGFLFADGVYEVIRSYRAGLFRPHEHVARFKHSLEALRIRVTDVDSLLPIADELISRNRLQDAEAIVYIQVTRGIHPRALGFPGASVPPTVYMETTPLAPDLDSAERGIACITVPDIRWARCDLKAIGLLPNVMARQSAAEKGAAEAVFVRDGVLTEGTHTSVFAVFKGTVITHAATNRILAGITRGAVLELCRSLAIPVSETFILEGQLPELEEMFLTCTTAEVLPVVRVNDTPIGPGKPGPVTRRLQSAFRALVTA